jgi:DNA-binding NarL/FixJ family response regulator
MQDAPQDPKNIIKVLIVDDHPFVRQGIERLINREEDMVACGQASDLDEALRVAEEATPHLVLVDLSLKNSSGFELISKLKAKHPSIHALVLSMYEEYQIAERALLKGARGYVMKTDNTACLIDAIRRVSKGEVYLSESLIKKKPVSALQGLPKPISDLLTAKEMEVFKLIAQGKRSREIAPQLGISMKTVDVHRQNIKAKLSLRNSAELIKVAVEYMGTKVP